MSAQTATVSQNPSSFSPFLTNHLNSYRSVLESGFSSLPQEGYVQSLQLIMIKVHKSCLALVGQFKLHHDGTHEGFPIFTNSIEVLVCSIGTRCQVIPDCFSQAKNLNSTFYGSHYFAAFKINYHDVVQLNAVDFSIALADPNALYVHENFTLQRIPDQWVPFNQIEGLKFFENFPPYLEIRVHQREKSLIEEQRRELEDASKAIMEVKQKQLQIIDKKSEAEAEKKEFEKQLLFPSLSESEQQKLKKSIDRLNQCLSTLDKQLKDAEQLIKKNGDKFTTVVNQKIINASHTPILRVLAQSEMSEIRPKFQQLLLCLSESVALTRNHFPEAFCTFIPTCSEGIKQKKLEFLNEWMSFLDTHYIQTVQAITTENLYRKEKKPAEVLVTKEALAQENLQSMHKNLQTLEQLVHLEADFLNILQKHPLGKYLLSNENRSYLERLRAQMKSLEEKLDGFVHSTIDQLVHRNEQKYIFDAFRFYHQRMDFLNHRLQEDGLVDPTLLGKERYISANDYAEERSLLDSHRVLLSYSIFLVLLSTDPSHPALPLFHQDIREGVTHPKSPIHLDNLPLISLLRICQQPFFVPFDSDLKAFVSGYEELNQIIRSESTTLGQIQQKWERCRESLDKMYQSLQLISSQLNAFVQKEDYDTIVTNLFKQLDKTSSFYKQTVDFKKCLGKSNPIEQTNLAQRLRNELNKLLLGEKDSDKIKAFENARFLSERVMLDGIQLLNEAISGFPKLNLRTWISFDDRRYQLKKHIYWPTEREGDPFYRSNNTHISIA